MENDFKEKLFVILDELGPEAEQFRRELKGAIEKREKIDSVRDARRTAFFDAAVAWMASVGAKTLFLDSGGVMVLVPNGRCGCGKNLVYAAFNAMKKNRPWDPVTDMGEDA